MSTAKALTSWVFIGWFLGLGLGCASAPAPIPARPSKQLSSPPRIIFEHSRPPDAEVILDGQSLGSLGRLMATPGVLVKAGVHRLEVKHPGYFPFRVELAVGPGGEVLKVALKRRASKAPKAPKHRFP